MPFEGYYWRIVHPERGLVVIAIGADCDGWGMATLAAHPGGFVRTSVEPVAVADPYAYGITVGGALRGDAQGIHVDLGPGARLDAAFDDVVRWPRRALGALGLAHAVPGLPQYWQPVVLGARVRGRATARRRGARRSTAPSPTRRRTGRAPSPTTGGGATPPRSASRA